MWDLGYLMGHRFASNFALARGIVCSRNLDLSPAPCLILDSACAQLTYFRGELAAHPRVSAGFSPFSDPLTPTPGSGDGGQEVGSWCLEILQVDVFGDKNGQCSDPHSLLELKFVEHLLCARENKTGGE